MLGTILILLIISIIPLWAILLAIVDLKNEKICHYCSYYNVLDNPYCKDCKRYKHSRIYIRNKIDKDEKKYGGKSYYKRK